jgi:Ni/Fe-hydrogenase 1 B-type cytochrome subunit
MGMKNEKVRVYAWEFPVRFTHWINFLCILALSVTGFYIGSPFIHAYSSKQWIMGWMRLIHFIAAYAFFMSVIIRMYWGLVGNKHACVCTWLGNLSSIGSDIKCYLLIDKSKCHVGHSGLAGLTYVALFAIFIFEIVSGFAMYSSNHSGVIWTLLGGWLTGIMLLPTIRLYHHLFMYVILAFVMVHVYIAWFLDSREMNGMMGSIFTGYKFVPEKDLEQ